MQIVKSLWFSWGVINQWKTDLGTAEPADPAKNSLIQLK